MNKGFTLVELLAVIIILGVLTLVTVVSVNPILKDAKKGLTDTQIDNIEEVASLYYIKYGMGFDDFELDNPRDCINVSELIKTGYIENDEVTNPKTGEKILGSVKVTYNSNNYIYEYQDNACTNYDKGIICERVESTELGQVPEGNFIAGDAYNCKVDPNRDPYKFYILTTPDKDSDMVNLIMDQNINSDGTPAGMIGIPKNGENVYNLVSWISDSTHGCGSDGDYCATNEKGPISAMTFLYNATKDWTNIEPVNYTYNDKITQGTTAENRSYTSFMSSNGVATITSLSGDGVTIGTSVEPLRARMPIYVRDTIEVTSKTNASYLYDNLDPEGKDAPYGYWTFSSNASDSNAAWYVYYGGEVAGSGVYRGGDGVRPVISVYKFQLE